MKELNIETKQLLVGLLLGDGHVGKLGDKSFVTLEQSIKHESYVNYVYNLLTIAGVSLHPIEYYSRSDKRYSSINESILNLMG